MRNGIDPKKLRNSLIEIYEQYVSGDREKAEGMAKEIDGLWSGAFIFSKEIEKAINNLTGLYIEPKISIDRASELLEDLKKLKQN